MRLLRLSLYIPDERRAPDSSRKNTGTCAGFDVSALPGDWLAPQAACEEALAVYFNKLVGPANVSRAMSSLWRVRGRGGPS